MATSSSRPYQGKIRYGAPNHEGRIWLFMRLTGLVMFITVVFHLLYMHMAVGVENITFENIDARWVRPSRCILAPLRRLPPVHRHGPRHERRPLLN